VLFGAEQIDQSLQSDDVLGGAAYFGAHAGDVGLHIAVPISATGSDFDEIFRRVLDPIGIF